MNEKDKIVGSYDDIEATSRAWTWAKGTTTWLPGRGRVNGFMSADDINESGDIVGRADLSILPADDGSGDLLEVNRAVMGTRAPRVTSTDA
jgi:hypothetical protein